MAIYQGHVCQNVTYVGLSNRKVISRTFHWGLSDSMPIAENRFLIYFAYANTQIM